MAALNGRLDPALLAVIPGTSRRCRGDVMPQVAALRAAFAAHFGRPLVVTDAYRPYEEQVWLKAQKGVYAATPGKSVHGWGLAFDFGSGVNLSITSPEHRWMVEHAGAFGLFHPAWARDFNPANGQHEPWHWEALGAVPVTRYAHLIPTGVTIPTPTGTVPADLIPEDDMYGPEQEAALLARLDQIVQQGADTTRALFTPGVGVAAVLSEIRERLLAVQEHAAAAATLGQQTVNGLDDPTIGALPQLVRLRGEVAALGEVVRQLSTTTGTTVDLGAVRSVVDDAISARVFRAEPVTGP